jgi:hypothetical protein
MYTCMLGIHVYPLKLTLAAVNTVHNNDEQYEIKKRDSKKKLKHLRGLTMCLRLQECNHFNNDLRLQYNILIIKLYCTDIYRKSYNILYCHDTPSTGNYILVRTLVLLFMLKRIWATSNGICHPCVILKLMWLLKLHLNQNLIVIYHKFNSNLIKIHINFKKTQKNIKITNSIIIWAIYSNKNNLYLAGGSLRTNNKYESTSIRQPTIFPILGKI